jgi:hypothetical protein
MAEKLERKNILLLLFLVLITYGIYVPIWFLNQKKALNSFVSKVNNSYVYFLLVIYIFSGCMLIYSLFRGENELINLLDLIINLSGITTTIILSFQVREILNEHYESKVSGILTFLLTIFYLQYEINKIEKKD